MTNVFAAVFDVALGPFKSAAGVFSSMVEGAQISLGLKQERTGGISVVGVILVLAVLYWIWRKVK